MSSSVGGFGGIVQELISPTKTPKPYTAPYVDPQKVQQQTNAGNLAALPTLEQIATGVDSFNLQQQNKNLTAAIPGYTGLVADASGTLGSWLKGEIPTDVSQSVQRASAAKSLAGGYGGSQFAGNLTARDLGLTSLNLQSKGEAALPGFLGSIAGLAIPHPFDVTSGFLTPAQGITAQQWDEDNRATQEWLKNRLDALPDPLMSAVGQAVGQLTNQVVSAAEAYATGGASLMAGSGNQGGGGGGGGGFGGSIFGASGGGGSGGSGQGQVNTDPATDPYSLGGYGF